MNTCHLNTGCGGKARNPCKRDRLYGLDILEAVEQPSVDEYACANLAVERMPFRLSYVYKNYRDKKRGRGDFLSMYETVLSDELFYGDTLIVLAKRVRDY